MCAEVHRQTTLLIPTHNRPNYLRRLLFFLEQLECGSLIRIFDSSESKLRLENEAACREFSTLLTVEYHHTELGVIDKFASALEHTDTPFVVFCADDDFVVPAAIHAGAEFLTANALYSCVGGKVVKLRTYGKESNIVCTLGRAYNLPHSSPLERCRLNANHWFSTFYNLYHTAILRENLRYTAQHCDFINARIYPEFLWDQLGALAGKVRILPTLFSVRQIHDECYGRLPGVQDLKNDHRYYRGFQEALADRLVESTGMPREEALRFVDQRFSYMLRPDSKRSTMVRIRREIVRTIRSVLDRFNDDNQLEGRRLPMRHPLRQDSAWQLAHHLIKRYPQGINSAGLEALRQSPPRRLAA